MDGDTGPEYRAGFHNFGVITRYNRSILYALAVNDLGRRIESLLPPPPIAPAAAAPMNRPPRPPSTLLVLAGCAREPLRPAPPPATAPARRSRAARRAARQVRQSALLRSCAAGATSVLPSAVGYVEQGIASWYGPDFHGGRTATGETYDMNAMTGAHPTLPLPTWVRVTNLENGRSVVVRLNDRGPFAKDRIIDLSRAAAEQLDMIRKGTARVEVRSLAAGRRRPRARGDARLLRPGRRLRQPRAMPRRSPTRLARRRHRGRYGHRVHRRRPHRCSACAPAPPRALPSSTRWPSGCASPAPISVRLAL